MLHEKEEGNALVSDRETRDSPFPILEGTSDSSVCTKKVVTADDSEQSRASLCTLGVDV